jgi:hypothetical protein
MGYEVTRKRLVTKRIDGRRKIWTNYQGELAISCYAWKKMLATNLEAQHELEIIFPHIASTQPEPKYPYGRKLNEYPNTP